MNTTPQGAGDFEPANRWVILTREMTLAQDVSITFSFSLSDGERARVVWRGEVHYDALPDAQSVAEQLVQQLVTEGFLSAALENDRFARRLIQATNFPRSSKDEYFNDRE